MSFSNMEFNYQCVSRQSHIGMVKLNKRSVNGPETKSMLVVDLCFVTPELCGPFLKFPRVKRIICCSFTVILDGCLTSVFWNLLILCAVNV